MVCKHILPIILGISTLLTSCEEKLPEEKLASFRLSYSLSTENGASMYDTKSTGADIFKEFYSKIMDGTLIAPDYELTFTDTATGEEYPVKGKWSSGDIVSLKPGTYDVTGTSTAQGNNIQQKCSITLKDRVSVNEGSSSITIAAAYDCSLIIFNDSTIAEIFNDNGTGTKEALFKFGDYFYAFVHTTLYEESSKDKAYLLGSLADGTGFSVPTAGLSFNLGKYYMYSSVNAMFSLPEMEDGGNGGDEGGDIATEDYPSAIRGVWESTKVEAYKDGKVVKGNRVASEIFGFGDDGILTEIDIDWVYLDDNDEDCCSKMSYSVNDGVVYLNGIVPMTIKKLTSSELQLEESLVTSAFSDYDRMVISFKKRTGIEDFADMIVGIWIPEKEETVSLDGEILETYDEYDGEYLQFDGKQMKNYDPYWDEFDVAQYKVECGCLIYEEYKTSVAMKITKLTDTELCMEAFDFYKSRNQGDPADCIERLYFKRNEDDPKYVQFNDALFEAYCVKNFDGNKDGKISYQEAKMVKKMSFDTKGMNNLDGIEYFTNLEDLECRLFDFNYTGDRKADGSFILLDKDRNVIEHSGISSIPLNKLQKLKRLNCMGNSITKLDFSYCPDLKSVRCGENILSALDFSNNLELDTLDFGLNIVSNVNVSKNVNLKWLFCSGNYLSTLDVRNNTELEHLFCNINQLSSLDVRNNTQLIRLYCTNNKLPELDVSKNRILLKLMCSPMSDDGGQNLLKYLYVFQGFFWEDNWEYWDNLLDIYSMMYSRSIPEETEIIAIN